MIKKYRRRPLEVEAFQWDGKDLTLLNHFVKPSIIVDFGAVYIETIVGKKKVLAGDYVAKDQNNQYYVYNQSDFERIYKVMQDNKEKVCKQIIKNYSAIEPNKILDQIVEDKQHKYVNWKIVSMSITNNDHGLFYGFVVYEKV